MNPFARGQQQQLGDWHPRQQRMSGDSISQWSQWCIDNDKIRGPKGPDGTAQSNDLGRRVANADLRDSYIAFCKQQGVRPADPSTFGKACTQMFGRKQRLAPKEWNERRPPAYDVPTAEAWQERLDARFRIPKKTTGIPEILGMTTGESCPGGAEKHGPVHHGVGVGISVGQVKR